MLFKGEGGNSTLGIGAKHLALNEGISYMGSAVLFVTRNHRLVTSGKKTHRYISIHPSSVTQSTGFGRRGKGKGEGGSVTQSNALITIARRAQIRRFIVSRDLSNL